MIELFAAIHDLVFRLVPEESARVPVDALFLPVALAAQYAYERLSARP